MSSKKLKKAIIEFGKDFEENMKQLVPVRSGTLKRSIKTFADIKGETVKGGVEMKYYGQYVNEGTNKMSAQPFINDAWAETRFDSDVDKAIIESIDSMFDVTFKK
tara:strand:+ start:3062 stop:3376 length:315 start_codon:yes stop_codon:yes gene_type:complete